MVSRSTFGGFAGPAEDLAELISISEARTASAEDVDPMTALASRMRAWTGDPNVMFPVAIGAVALGVLLLLPSDGRRRR